MRVVIAGINKALGHLLSVLDALRRAGPVVDDRQYLEVLGVLIGVVGVFSTDHLLMQLLSRSNADDFLLSTRSHHPCKVCNFHGRDLFHIDLSALHVLERMPYKLDPLLKGNHEAGHALVGNGQHPFIFDRHEKWDNRATRAHYVAVTHYGKTSTLPSRIGVTCNK